MRLIPLPALMMLAACTGQTNNLAWPGLGVGNGIQNIVYDDRRGGVEVFVKTNHAALIREIRAGGGPTLSRAMDAARIAHAARPAATLRFQSDLALYNRSPDALVTALMVHGG